MNSLNRDITVGEIVVVDRAFFGDDVSLPCHMRAFVCLGGRGMLRDTSSDEITGRWYAPPTNEDIIDGSFIVLEETLQFSGEMIPLPVTT